MDKDNGSLCEVSTHVNTVPCHRRESKALRQTFARCGTVLKATCSLWLSVNPHRKLDTHPPVPKVQLWHDADFYLAPRPDFYLERHNNGVDIKQLMQAKSSEEHGSDLQGWLK